MAKTIDPISSFKRAAELVSQVRESRAPIYITQNGQAAAVLVDVESYEEQQQAFALLKMCLDGDQSIDAGRSKTLKQLRAARRKAMRSAGNEDR
ncbi:MAG: type II toxin-antitoxin system prevent-host-death family antitoxin [Kofleriaceae bacterium]|nr:type II toxin-antitoxin system prevent-host-death family antitoxin [Kofleriaceae bacterium]